MTFFLFSYFCTKTNRTYVREEKINEKCDCFTRWPLCVTFDAGDRHVHMGYSHPCLKGYVRCVYGTNGVSPFWICMWLYVGYFSWRKVCKKILCPIYNVYWCNQCYFRITCTCYGIIFTKTIYSFHRLIFYWLW